jgi:putative SOS response-associated peptidase YedK
VAAWFDVDEVVAADRPPRWNVAPTDEVLIVVESREGRCRLGDARWGLVPSWSKGPADVGARMINARSESLLDRPAFRRAFARHRCIVPSDGFYEWEHRDGGRVKQPWLVAPADGGLFAFAGLWEVWSADDGGPRLTSCTIVTTEANDDVRPLHDRMPAVLARDDWAAWLDRGHDDPAALVGLLRPAPAGSVVLRPVSTRVNDVRNDGPDLLDPPDEEVLPLG